VQAVVCAALERNQQTGVDKALELRRPAQEGEVVLAGLAVLTVTDARVPRRLWAAAGVAKTPTSSAAVNPHAGPTTPRIPRDCASHSAIFMIVHLFCEYAFLADVPRGCSGRRQCSFSAKA